MEPKLIGFKEPLVWYWISVVLNGRSPQFTLASSPLGPPHYIRFSVHCCLTTWVLHPRWSMWGTLGIPNGLRRTKTELQKEFCCELPTRADWETGDVMQVHDSAVIIISIWQRYSFITELTGIRHPLTIQIPLSLVRFERWASVR